MTVKISGLVSGMDTDSIIQELVSAASEKKTQLENEQTKLEWKIDAWEELNEKVQDFYNSYLDVLKYSSSYTKKTTTVADESIATVTTNTNAVNGTQTLSVQQLAKAGYLTGEKLSDDGSVTTTTTLSELSGGELSDSDTILFQVTSGGETTTVELSGSSTVSNVISALKNAGITASFDEDNQRIFISASDSGEENDFTLCAGNTNGIKALSSLGLLSSDATEEGSATYEAYSYWAECYEYDDDSGEYVLNDTTFQEKVDETTAEKAASLLEELDSLEETVTSLRTARTKLTDEDDLSDNYTDSEDAQKELADAALVLIDYYQSIVDSDDATEAEKSAAQEAVDRAQDAYNTATSAASSLGITLSSTASYNLRDAIESDSKEMAAASNELLNGDAYDDYINDGAVRIAGQDAVITLNGAEFTSSSNTFTINGLTLTANSTSAINGYDADGNAIYAETTLTTADDIDGIYDMIKNCISAYNELIIEMDTLYNADSASDYDILTSEEKEAMSDDEIEAWETKIKDALLRKDSDLSTLISTFKNTMLGSYTINGKSYSLSSFGISTLGYFDSADNEKGAYHIDGDEDDSNTSGNTDKLKAAIASDPDTVVSFFTSLFGDLQSKVSSIMKSTDLSSYGNVYSDKSLDDEYDDYTDKIEAQEDKIAALEDRYYSQFTSMETALSKLNSTSSYISSLFSS